MERCIITIREEILKMVINEITLKILNQIIDDNDDRVGSTLSITKIGITRKQFYIKLSELTTKGFIKKEKGKYYLTTFGKIVYDLTSDYKNKLDSIIEDYWKFKAIDLLDVSDEFTSDERYKIIEHLFKQINQNNEEEHIDPSDGKVFPYIQYLQKRNLSSKI
jgi:DNA-binding HxlR family transcriptional regulator